MKDAPEATCPLLVALATMLGRSRGGLGAILGSKRVPQGSQNRVSSVKKSLPERMRFSNTFLRRCLMIFRLILHHRKPQKSCSRVGASVIFKKSRPSMSMENISEKTTISESEIVSKIVKKSIKSLSNIKLDEDIKQKSVFELQNSNF